MRIDNTVIGTTLRSYTHARQGGYDYTVVATDCVEDSLILHLLRIKVGSTWYSGQELLDKGWSYENVAKQARMNLRPVN